MTSNTIKNTESHAYSKRLNYRACVFAMAWASLICIALVACTNTHTTRADTNNKQQHSKNNDSDAPKRGRYHYRNNYQNNPEFKQFVKTAIEKYKFTQNELDEVFSQIKNRPDIIKLMNRQAEDNPWYKYRKNFLRRDRILGGVRFWNKNARWLAMAQEKYGIPAQIIVAIIGVETRYGRHAGRSKILETLSTFAFDYPRRKQFFQNELFHFLILCREQKLNPLKLRGSFAGAMGLPQFMPSSYRRYAIDFNGDGKKDLFSTKADIIGSVANYFYTYGWKRGQAIATRARVIGRRYKKLPQYRLKPYLTLGEFAKFNVRPRYHPKRWGRSRKASLISLERKRFHEYWLGFHNFYVISRYNRSTLYAMAVYQLSERIKHERARQMRRKARKHGKSRKSKR